MVLDLAAPRAIAHTVSIGRAPRCSRSHSARLTLVLQPWAVLPRGRMCCYVVCLCTREQRRSPPARTLAICNESIKATVATVWVSTVCRTCGGGTTLAKPCPGPFRRHTVDESECGHPRRGSGNPMAQLAGPRCRE
jgi:hypothetical protein